jgi:hypothetical protein
MAENKWIKLGAVKASKPKDGKSSGGMYIQLGTPKSKYEPVNVKLVITDLKGNVLREVENPNLTVQDPRKRNGITDEQKAKIPEYVKAEISLPPTK